MTPLAERYEGWDGASGRAILAGERSLADRALAPGSIQSRVRDARNLQSPINQHV
jgi:xylose isomerase